ncbi:MAG: hypothetical protein ACI8RA_002690 [Chlamydiales bacterium]|jgi:hypothetical protein
MKYIFQNDDIRLVIEEDIVGWYLFVYRDGNMNTPAADYLQDTLNDVFEEAEEMFGVQHNQWKKVC